jgi:hypothetical protein
MLTKKNFAVFLILIANCSIGYCQYNTTSSLDTLAGSFIRSLRKDPKEKIFLDTDKWFYTAGETIWFKAYSLNVLSNRPIHISKNIFLDLVNDRDSVINQVLLNNDENKTAGNILLSPSLKEGYYWLRAYTRNILTQDSSRIFVKPIYILNTGRSDPHFLSDNTQKTITQTEDTSAPQLVFYPEGGSIIAGTTATIAFRAFNSQGNPVDVSGWVTDTRDSIAATFKTILPGLGKFSFDAWNPRKYTAHIKWKNNRELSYPLPRINQFASQLSLLEQTDQTFKMRISLGDSLYNKNKRTYLLGISRDSICFAATGTDMYNAVVPKSSFPKGKATLFLFDDKDKIVSERAIYIDTGAARIVTETDKSDYGPREKVKLNVNASTAESHPLVAVVSLSVTYDRFAPPVPEQDILSGFHWDDVQLPETGTTAGPGWEKKYSTLELDLIMLMQKSLYADWKFSSSVDQTVANYTDPDSNILNIRGVVNSKKNLPVKGCTVYLLSKKKGILKNQVTDESGRFDFSVPDFEDGEQYNMKVTDSKGNGLEGKIVLDNFAFPQFATPRQLKKRFDVTELTKIRNFKSLQLDSTVFASGNGNLKAVTVKGEKPSTVTYDQKKRISSNSYIIPGDQLSNGDPTAVVNAIKNVPGLNTGMTSISGASGSMNSSGGMISGASASFMVILDGVPYNGAAGNSVLTTVDPQQVDFIEVLIGPEAAYYGIEGSTAVILVNTISKSREITSIDSKGAATIFPRGYFKQTEFSSPDYDKKETAKKPLFPDQRATIYWKPDLLTNNAGKADVIFYTADDNGMYTASLLGLTATGELVYKQIKIRRQ